MHIGIHIKGAPKIYEDDDSKVITFIDKYITFLIPNEKEYPELNKLVIKDQVHKHNRMVEVLREVYFFLGK